MSVPDRSLKLAALRSVAERPEYRRDRRVRDLQFTGGTVFANLGGGLRIEVRSNNSQDAPNLLSLAACVKDCARILKLDWGCWPCRGSVMYRRSTLLALLLTFCALSGGPLAAETGYVTVSDGTRIYYQVEGEGKPVVLMHGWSGSNRFFDKNFESLAKEFRVYRIDIRGHGDSDKPENGYTMLRYAKDLHDFLKAEDLDDVTQPDAHRVRQRSARIIDCC